MAGDETEGAAARRPWPWTDKPPRGAVEAELGGEGCGEPLVLVAEASAWNPECKELFFSREWAEGEGGPTRHQLCLRFASPADGASTLKRPSAGEPQHTLCAFQILSAEKHWDWLLYPRSRPRGGAAWGKENILIPGVPDAVQAALGSQQESQGRFFGVVEPPGTVITICVELLPGPSGPSALVWYEFGGYLPSFQLPALDAGPPEAAAAAGAQAPEPRTLRRPEHADSGSEGPDDCTQELYLVCEACDWSLKEEKLVFQPMWSELKESWSWTPAGVAAVEGAKQWFGNPQAGGPFTEANFGAVAHDHPDTTHQGLCDMGLIKRESKRIVRHHAGVRLGQASAISKTGEPVAWEFAFVSLTFQVLSRKRGWDWRLFPGKRPEEGGPDSWGAENILVPGAPEAVSVAHGGHVHGRNFHIVEPHGTFVTVAVELIGSGSTDSPELQARVWYERSRVANSFMGSDARPPVKKEVLLALRLQGQDAAREYDRVVRARCPRWWCAWDREEERRRQAAAGGSSAWRAAKARRAQAEGAWATRSAALEAAKAKDRATFFNTAPKQGEEQKEVGKPFTRNEAIEHLTWCIHYLVDKKHAPVLQECRQNSTVKCGLFDTFPYLPPKAMSILSSMVQVVLDKAKCYTLHEFLDRFAAVAWDSKVFKVFERFVKLIETGAFEQVPETPSASRTGTGAAAGLSGKRAPRFSLGMNVAIKWKVDSEGSRYLSALEGRVGTLTAFDKTASRWTVTFRSPEACALDVAPEHLVAAAAPAPALPGHGEEAAPNDRCDLCNRGLQESELIKLGCGQLHRYCHDCLRRWVQLQTAPRCYRCLADRNLLEMPKHCSAAKPWLALVQSEVEATLEHRVSRLEVDRLPCICYSEVRPGAVCVLIGHARAGERCLVGHMSKAEDGPMAGAATAYLKDGSLVTVRASGCLGPDDCLASGRAQRREPCPAKAPRFRYSAGLVCASLGCACLVREALNFLGISRASMPFDWLISRVEGVQYFLRHSFRDFCHHDGKSEIIHVDARLTTTFRSAYHAFLHHDLDEPGVREAFKRRGERLAGALASAGRYPTTPPVLLVRLCARSPELDAADELYSTLRLIGGQKVYLLVIISEQSSDIGAVVHAFQPNLIFYVAGSTAAGHVSPDLLSAIRFGIDYASLMASSGDPRAALEAHAVSKRSPVISGSALRWQLSSPHCVWLKRDSKGRSSTSDIDGCFDSGPSQFFPGRFHLRKLLEASPYSSPELMAAVETGDPDRIMSLVASGADANAWDVRGETPLFRAARRADGVTCAALLLAAGDPNCRAVNGSRPKDHVGQGKPGSRCVRTLLLLAGSLDPVPEEQALAAVFELPEPFRRQLCGRLGLRAPPDPVRRRPAAAAGPLSLRPLLADAESRGPDHVAALVSLRTGAKNGEAQCRRAVRALLRRWHPDKHAGRPREQREHAAEVFCYVRDICNLALPNRDVGLRTGPAGH